MVIESSKPDTLTIWFICLLQLFMYNHPMSLFLHSPQLSLCLSVTCMTSYLFNGRTFLCRLKKPSVLLHLPWASMFSAFLNHYQRAWSCANGASQKLNVVKSISSLSGRTLWGGEWLMCSWLIQIHYKSGWLFCCYLHTHALYNLTTMFPIY